MYTFDEVNHIHQLDGKALMGSSTVTGVINKPLTWWASGLACEKFGWINKGNKEKGWTPKETRLVNAGKVKKDISEMSDEEYLTLLDEAYAAHNKKKDSAAQTGTSMHQELENYVKAHMRGETYTLPDKLLEFHYWVIENVDKFIYSEAHCYSKKLWVGGISDVGVKLKNGKTYILDFKSSKEAYENQFIQAAIYDLLQTENGWCDPVGNKILDSQIISGYLIIPFGAERFTVSERYNVEELKEAGKACITLYKLINQ